MLRLVVSLSLVCILLAAPSCWRGVSLSGLEWGGVKPTDSSFNAEADYFIGRGMNLFRFPFSWEKLQPQLYGQFNETYLGFLDGLINHATSRGAYVLVDPHNYARYNGKIIGDGVPVSAFADLWERLATHYKDNDKLFFGLMNEPHSMSTELWLSDANAAIAAIRATGAKQLITVPGNAWTGAWSWYSNSYGTPNAKVMLGIKDPLNNFIIEVHQYMDIDGSGTHDTCVNATIGSTRMEAFTGWCRQHKYKAILAEWAGARNNLCYEAVTDMVKYLQANKDIYVAWTWWAAGPWWNNYMFDIDPINGQTAPQLNYLQPYINCN